MSEERFVQAYKENIKNLGVDDPRSLLTPDWDRLREVYYELLQHVSFDGKTLLDVGCGYGGFVEFLYKVAHQKLGYYFGIDMLEEAIAVATERLYQIKGMCGHRLKACDVLSAGNKNLVYAYHMYDIVIALEVMGTMSSAEEFIDALFRFSTEWIVFTGLSPYTYHGSLHAYAPEDVLKYCLGKAKHVRLIHEREGSYMVIIRRT